MNENQTPKKHDPKKKAVLIAGLSLIALIAAAVLMFIFLKKPAVPQGEVTAYTDTNSITTLVDSETKPLSEPRVEIVPTHNTPEGIQIDTEFIVRTASPMKIAKLTECLSVKTDETYRLRESETESEYILAFDAPLQYDAIYQIEYADGEERPVSFAFQTVENFKIIHTIPGGDNAYGIPLNSGIEITFNEKIEGDLSDYFEITPFVSGTFENVGNTYIYTSEGFMPSTSYSVVVRKDLKSAESGRTLAEDYCFEFYTQWADIKDSVSIRGDAYETFLPDDEVFVELYATGVFLEKTYRVDLYELKTSEDYLTIQDTIKDSPESLSQMTCIKSLETQLFRVDNGSIYNSYNYIMLKQKLPNGWYMIKITTENEGKKHTLYKFIQVSPIAVYSESVSGEMLFWINDANTGLPASGAEITLQQGKITTDADGLARITTPEKISESLTINYGDYPAFVYTTGSQAPAILAANERYYHYVYTDRKAYRPTDTIDMFGVIRERYDDYKITPNDKVTVKIGDMAEIPVTLDDYGTFYVRIPIDGMKGYLNFYLYLNGETIDSEYINIVDYDNAKYLIGAKTDKTLYRPGEPMSIAISVETYDGTAAQGLEILRSGTMAATTDKNGIATVAEYAEKNSKNYSWNPSQQYFYYDVGKTENKIQNFSVPYTYVPSDIMLEYEIASDGEISFLSSDIVMEAIEKGLADSSSNVYSLSPDLYRGESVDINFTVEIYKQQTIRQKISERYDYINKVTVPLYEYNMDTAVVSAVYKRNTTDGKATLSGLPLSGFISEDIYAYYYAVVSYTDTSGNLIQFDIRYGSGWNYYRDTMQTTIKKYYFDLYNTQNESLYSLGVGEIGSVKLNEEYDYYSGKATQDIAEGRILATLVHDKNRIISTAIGSPAGTPVTFTADCIYNVRVTGAYFNGRYIYPIEYGREIRYDYTEKALDFNLSFDQESYKPGDVVTAEIKMTDQNGNPKKGLVNISVVDESVFAEYQHNPTMPGSYYASVYRYITYSDYVSYTQHEFLSGFGVEMGGGGGEDYIMRKDFADNPAFTSVETDEAGIARVTFKLADKITSWRVTVHGVTDDNYVGNDRANIISTLPFAIDLVMNDDYVTGDDIALLVKPQGNAFYLGETDVRYDVSILNNGSPAASGTGTTQSSFSFNGGKLPEGDYTVSVKAEAKTDTGTFRDAMEKEIHVKQSGVILALTATDILSETTPTLRDYDVKLSPVRVKMSNDDTHSIAAILSSCIDYTSQRTDFAAAAVFARKYQESSDQKIPLSISPEDYRGVNLNSTYSGGKSELFYGGADVDYTARFYACFPETASSMKESIRRYVNNYCPLYQGNVKSLAMMFPENIVNEHYRAAGYLTLAAIGDTVLLDIYAQVGRIEHSANQSKFTEEYDEYLRILYYAAALCTLGDDYSAQELMANYQFNFKSSAFISLDPAERARQTEMINTLKLYITTHLDPDAAYAYLKEKSDNTYVSDVCEKINFIRHFTLKSGTRSEVMYTLDGETRQAVLENREVLTLELTKEQFEALNIRQVSGNTAIDVSFYGSADNFSANKEKILLEKQILNSDAFNAQYGDSEYTAIAVDSSVYYVVLKFTVPYGAPLSYRYYTLCDTLPSNMRFINSGISYSNNVVKQGSNYAVSNPEKQSVTLRVSAYTRSDDEITVVYNAIRISDADAVVEKAYISRDYNVDHLWGASK